jgi:hypothetical protein
MKGSMELAKGELEQKQGINRPKMNTLRTEKFITSKLNAEDDLESQPDALHKSYTFLNGSSTNFTSSSNI